MSDRKLKTGTYWIVTRSQNNNGFAVKAQWKDNETRLREVFHADGEWHFSLDGKFTLPVSYEPYMDKQNFFIIEEPNVRGIVFPDDLVIDFFGTLGAEIIDHERDGEYLDATEINWSKPLLAKFEGMRFPKLSNKEKRTKLSEPQAAKIVAQAKKGPILLQDKSDGTMISYRLVTEYKGLLVIVKYFPQNEEADRFSVKLYDKPNLVAKVMTYWNTNDPIDIEANIKVFNIMRKYFWRVVDRLL